MSKLMFNGHSYTGGSINPNLATDVVYDNTNSNLSATNVQNAIDEVVDRIYPVGSIYMSVTDSTAAMVEARFGGTWVAFGSGRTLVGFDSTQSEFSTVEGTGGNKTHTHDVGIRLNGYYYSTSGLEGASGLSGIVRYGSNNTISAPAAYTTAVTGATVTGNSSIVNSGKSLSSSIYQSIGNSSYTSNLQPYITVYMYKRTA